MPKADAATHLYRIAQEAVNNALKHGQAKQILITLAEAGSRWEMRVEDNGQGFDADGTRKPAWACGSCNIAPSCSGTVGSPVHLGQGARVLCTLPRKA
jgi:signal transduction histidine kinase